MPQHDQKMRQYYAQRAPYYDVIYAYPERQADLRWLEQYLPRQFSNSNLLEIAAGTDYWTQFIACEAASITAVDCNQETLDVLSARELGEHVSATVHDAFLLSTLGRRFESAFAGCWFSHLPRARWREFLQGLNQSLEPGARVVLLDNLHTRSTQARVDTAGDGWQLRDLPDGSQHQVLKNFPLPQEMHDAIKGVGHSAVWRELEHYWVFEYSSGEA